MESLSSTEDNFATQKIMAVLGALCILYFLFSPLPEQYHDKSVIIYMVKGHGEQWALLGFAFLTTVAAYFRFKIIAVFSSVCLILTLAWVMLYGVFRDWFLWTIINARIPHSILTDSFLFKTPLRFLVKSMLHSSPTWIIWSPNNVFQNVSALQVTILVLGTVLLLMASFQRIRVLGNKRKPLEPTLT
jgi:hypothetical protein